MDDFPTKDELKHWKFLAHCRILSFKRALKEEYEIFEDCKHLLKKHYGED